MSKIKVLDHYLDVDIRAELEAFEFENATWSDEKLIACSPFRVRDSHPSFFVSFQGEFAGVFGDSAYEDERYKAGPLPKLLAFLRNESFEEACAYLIEKYAEEAQADDIILEGARVYIEKERVKKDYTIDKSVYSKDIDNTYLRKRGIHSKIIELAGVFKTENAVGIPWKNFEGDVVAIKYRSTKSKFFWYEKGGQPLAQLVYGIDYVFRNKIKKAVICEAEIDALTWQSAGIYAIAIGGARLNEEQAELIVRSGLETLIIAGDNDNQGRKFNEIVKQRLQHRIDLYEVDYDDFNDKKDANEVGSLALREVRFNSVQKQLISI